MPAALDFTTLDSHVREAARTFGLPESWIHAVIRQESRGRPNAVSRAGAMGLMQLMPKTWVVSVNVV
jgi:soluble lytic murein transglycosylase-like protein